MKNKVVQTDLPADDADRRARRTEQRQLLRQVWFSGSIAIVLVLGSLPAMMGVNLAFVPMWLHNPWLQLVLTTPVLFWAGRSFFINAWKAFKRHTASMDEPSHIVVKSGRTVRLNFDRQDPSHCLEEIRLPEFHIAQKLALNQVTPIEFRPDRPGRYEFSCGMNMFRGVVEVQA